MALNKAVSKNNYLTKDECLERAKEYKEKNNLNLSLDEIFNFYLDKVLKFNENKKVVTFDLSNPNKDELLKEVFDSNNDVFITSSGLLGDFDKYYKLYLIRETIEKTSLYKNFSFEENFEDDGITFKSSLCIRKNG